MKLDELDDIDCRSAISGGAEFLFVLLLSVKIHKIPLNTARTQLEHKCWHGAPVRRSFISGNGASARPEGAFRPSRWFEQIEVNTIFAGQCLRTGNCVRQHKGPAGSPEDRDASKLNSLT